MTSQRSQKLSTESSNSWCLQVDTEAYQAGQAGQAGQEAKHRDGGRSENLGGHTSNRVSVPVSFLYGQEAKEYGSDTDLEVDTEAYQGGQESELEVGQKFSTSNSSFEITEELMKEAKQDSQEAKCRDSRRSENLVGHASNRLSAPVSFLYGQNLEELGQVAKKYGVNTDLKALEILLPRFEDKQAGQVQEAGQEANHRDGGRSKNFRGHTSNRLSAPVSFLYGQNLEGHVPPIYPSVPPVLKQAGQKAKHRDSRRSENLSGHTSNRVSVPVSFLYGQQLGGHAPPARLDLKQDGQEAKQAC